MTVNIAGRKLKERKKERKKEILEKKEITKRTIERNN